MLGRRRRDDRPPIEVIGAEPPDETVAQVTIGGEPKRRRGVLLAAVLALATVVGVSLGISGDDPEDEAGDRPTTTLDRPSRSTRRSTTSTEPAPAEPSGPVLPVPTGAGLLLGTYDGRGSWVHFDLDTGVRTVVELDRAETFGSPVPVRGGVVRSRESGLEFQPLPTGDSVRLSQAPRGSGSENRLIYMVGGRVFPTSPDAVWLVSSGLVTESGAEVESAQLVEARTGRPLSAQIEVPPGGVVVGATSDGLVVTAGGRAYLLTGGAGIRTLGSGSVLATSPRFIALERCDERISCGVFVLEPATGREIELQGVVRNAASFGRGAVISDEGEIAVMSHHLDGVELWLGSVPDGGVGLAGTSDRSLSEGGAWLPGGQGFVVVTTTPRRRVVRLTVADGEVHEHPIAALADERADFALVIPP